MKISHVFLAATFALGAAAPALAQSSNDLIANQYYGGQGLLTGRSVGRADTYGPTLGRFTKTPTGNFNSTDALEDGYASGMGSGPGAGSPNGN